VCFPAAGMGSIPKSRFCKFRVKSCTAGRGKTRNLLASTWLTVNTPSPHPSTRILKRLYDCIPAVSQPLLLIGVISVNQCEVFDCPSDLGAMTRDCPRSRRLLPSPSPTIPDWRALEGVSSQGIPDWRRVQQSSRNWRRVGRPSPFRSVLSE
jgi:hypothetical protein